MTEAKKGSDVQKYESAIAAMQEYAPNEPEVTTDQVWIEHKKRLVKAETDKMELELKGYKNNLIKESIRVRSLIPNLPIWLLTPAPQDGLR